MNTAEKTRSAVDQVLDFRKLSSGELGEIVGGLSIGRSVECKATSEQSTEPEQDPLEVETQEWELPEEEPQLPPIFPGEE